jgi:hypothetical protein
MNNKRPTPTNKKLYDTVIALANKKFLAPSSIYRSSWIVKEYKKRGGEYSGTINKAQGLLRWYKENWINLNKPIKSKTGKIIGYEKCGRKSSNSKEQYPLCRPEKRVTKNTPKTYKELSKKQIDKAKIAKKKVTYKKHITPLKI